LIEWGEASQSITEQAIDVVEWPMVQMMIEVPEEALTALQKDAQEFALELKIVAAVKWYELKCLSQERAARLAGLSRAEFLEALGRFRVSPFQYGPDEILEEAHRE
jgi:predicted HTH domain antitoxin